MSIPLRAAPRRRPRSLTAPISIGVALLALVVAPVVLLRAWGGGGAPSGGLRIEPLSAAANEARKPPPPPQPYLDTHRVVAYYGNPLAEGMGIIGEYPPDEVIRRVKAQADAYQKLDPSRQVVPAIHFIYAVAQERAGPEGVYLLRMEDDLVQKWVDLTRDNGMLLFLDIQFGRSTVERELPHLYPFLKEPHVHLSLDPEFAWGPDEYPLIDIGHIDGGVVNRAQALLQQFVKENHLSSKIIVVHQFRFDMLTEKASIRPYDQIELVIDADGFGSRQLKLDQWTRVIQQDNVQRAGIKLFYKHDARNGGLMTEAEVLALTPSPQVIIYQ